MFRGIRILLVLTVTGFLLKATESNKDPCLRGFTNTLPPMEEWENYEVLNVDDDRSLLYPELKFACEGTLNEITFPVFLKDGLIWSNLLGLRVQLWRQQSSGGYTLHDTLAFLPTGRKTTVTFNRRIFPLTKKGKATTQVDDYHIQKGDIIGFRFQNDRQSNDYNVRQNVPLLLRPAEVPTDSHSTLLPMVMVNFSSTSGDSQTPDMSEGEEGFEGQRIGSDNRKEGSNSELSLGCNFALPVAIAVVVTQIEATLLSSITIVFIIYFCHLRKRGKETNSTSQTKQKERKEDATEKVTSSNLTENRRIYKLPNNDKVLSSSGDKEYSEVTLHTSPAYGLQSIRDTTPDYRKYI